MLVRARARQLAIRAEADRPLAFLRDATSLFSPTDPLDRPRRRRHRQRESRCAAGGPSRALPPIPRIGCSETVLGVSRTLDTPRTQESCGGQIRTDDLRVMSPTSCHCSTPQREYACVGHYPSSRALRLRRAGGPVLADPPHSSDTPLWSSGILCRLHLRRWDRIWLREGYNALLPNFGAGDRATLVVRQRSFDRFHRA